MGEEAVGGEGALGARPALNRADILRTALRVRLEDDARTPSMRRLAAELDVTPMALYRHFDGKDDILLAMADELLAAQELPSQDTPWQLYLRELSLLLRTLLRSEPFVVGVFARRPVVSPAAQYRLVKVTDVLTRAGFTHDDALRAYATVHIFTLGFCMLEQARRASGTLGPAPDTTPLQVSQITNFVSEAQFLASLDTILAGLAAGAESTGSGRDQLA
jgi:AcrR family transcriptional regulator